MKLDLDFFLLEVLGSVESNAQLYLFFIIAILEWDYDFTFMYSDNNFVQDGYLCT